jgi:uncharacterized protein (TIGR00369 family)
VLSYKSTEYYLIIFDWPKVKKKMENLIELYKKVNKYGEANEMRLSIEKPGEIIYEMEIKEQHMATPIAAHGGAVAGMMDGVLGVAALSITAPEGKLVSTVEFKINFFNPVYKGDILEGRGKVESKGKRILVCSGEIKAKNRDVVIAKAMGTFNAYPFEKAGFTQG